MLLISARYQRSTFFACATLVCSSTRLLAADYLFSYIDVPGSGGRGTLVFGGYGNNLGGEYYTATGERHGFVRIDGTFTTVDYPLSAPNHTEVRGVYQSTAVGIYVDSGRGFDHGFIFSGGTFTAIDAPFPGTANTLAEGIYQNTIVGSYQNDTGWHGFSLTNGIYTNLDDPLATNGTFATRISGDTIVGLYQTGNSMHGFSERGGIYTSLDVPFAGFGVPAGTAAFGIDGDTVAGYYTNGAGFSGFVESGGNYSSVFDPDYQATYAYAISGNTLFGTVLSKDGSNYRGFAATPIGVPEPNSLYLVGLSCVALMRRRNIARN